MKKRGRIQIKEEMTRVNYQPILQRYKKKERERENTTNNKFDNLEERDNFLEIHIPPKTE